MPQKQTSGLVDPSAHVALAASKPTLSMEQMIDTNSAFFKANDYEYKPPRLVSNRNQVSVMVDDFPSFFITKTAGGSSIKFVGSRALPITFGTVKDLEAVLQQELPKAKRPKPHVCIPPPQPQQPLPVVPSGLKRQPAAEHGGLTIEAMTTAVIAALDKHKYTYELPHAYSAFRPFDTITVPECSFQPRHPNDYSVPQITFTEAYKATTMMSPPEKNTTPATIVWYGYRRDVKTIEEIANHIDQCHAKFESDRHANWEIVAEKTINAHIGEFIGQIMSKAAHTFQDKAASRKRIFDKVHDAAVKALKSEVPSHH